LGSKHLTAGYGTIQETKDIILPENNNDMGAENNNHATTKLMMLRLLPCCRQPWNRSMTDLVFQQHGLIMHPKKECVSED